MKRVSQLRREVIGGALVLITGLMTGVLAVAVRGDGVDALVSSIRDPLSSVSGRAGVEWLEADPQAGGLDAGKLRKFAERQEELGATSLVVVRGNRLVYEWYAPGRDSDYTPGIAALAKGVVGSVALAAGLTDGRLTLSDPAATYLDEWQSDQVRSNIQVRDLAFHTSGIEDVDFEAGEAGLLTGWKELYYESPPRRFEMALTTAPVRFEPGSRFAYSGVGYYALADLLERILEQDLERYLSDRVYQRVGIPRGAWSVSYGGSYRVGDRTLYALGSGARFSPRALARIGQLMLDGGCWEREYVLAPEVVDAILARGESETSSWAMELADSSGVVPGAGWWLNRGNFWPFLPVDAFVGMGAGREFLLVVPSEDLILVRTGTEGFTEHGEVAPRLRAAGEALFRPLMATVVGKSSRQGDVQGGSASIFSYNHRPHSRSGSNFLGQVRTSPACPPNESEA